MRLPEQFRPVPRDEAKLLKIAKAVATDAALIGEYRSALDEAPKGKDEWEIDPGDPTLARVDAALAAIDGRIRSLFPGVSSRECLDARHLIAEWVLGRHSI